MLPQANTWKAERSRRSRLSKRTKKEIEHWEGLTHIYVDFTEHYIHLNGAFTPATLSQIASIKRKYDKELDTE